MGFADNYFEKYQSEERFIIDQPSSNLGLIVTIPCFNEENTVKALESLYFCVPPKRDTEVIVLINYPGDKDLIYKIWHSNLYASLKDWAQSHSRDKLKFHILIKKLPAKTAGVGLARKIAMDEALRRFNLINKSSGIIASFDADCTCDTNYLQALENMFEKYPKATGCSIYFEHPVTGDEFSHKVYNAIIQYELYLRYYIEALRSTGYPYAFHCVGSAFAVRADIYARQGGMNKRKAGEEFYFLQKIIPLGNYYELNTTKIIPSPRESDRVPYGTGKVISRIIQSNEEIFVTYHPESFEYLGNFFSDIIDCFKQPPGKIRSVLKKQHGSIQEFLKNKSFPDKMEEINANCKILRTSKKRFFNWFNGLMILQFLNESHMQTFKKIPVNNASAIILNRNYSIYLQDNDPGELLEKLRQFQRNSE